MVNLLETLPQTQNTPMVELVRKWGNQTTDAILDPATQIFTCEGISGLMGYRQVYDHAIVFGDPICAPEDKIPLAKAFNCFASKKNWQVIYLIVSEEFAKAVFNNLCSGLIEFGRELFLDPFDDPRKKTGVYASLVRRKVRHAQKNGAHVKEYIPYDPQIEADLENLGEQWLKTRQGPHLHISHIHLFDDRLGKRWFYAEKNHKIIGVVLLNQLQAYQGWLLNHLMVTPEAENGTPELLVVNAIETLANEGCHYVTFGSVIQEQLGEIKGFGKFTEEMARLSFKAIQFFFHLRGTHKFWEKFDPETKPVYLLFEKGKLTFRSIMCLIQTLK